MEASIHLCDEPNCREQAIHFAPFEDKDRWYCCEHFNSIVIRTLKLILEARKVLGE